MGWDVTSISRGIKTKAYLEWAIGKRPNYELVKLVEGKANHGYKPFFAALKKQDGTIFGAVIITKRNGRSGTIAEKWIGEDEGPGQLAPASFIKLLTPTQSEWANEWRNKSLNQVVENTTLVG